MLIRTRTEEGRQGARFGRAEKALETVLSTPLMTVAGVANLLSYVSKDDDAEEGLGRTIFESALNGDVEVVRKVAPAITKASVTNCAVISALIDQPTTRRENKSITAAT
jgi:hypothetical protein